MIACREPLLLRLIKKLAPEMGARLFLEETFQYAGCIVFDNGRRSFFKNASFGINPLGATEISRDKDYAAWFLKSFGYRTTEHILVMEDGYRRMIGRRCPAGAQQAGMREAARFADAVGFPLVVKPNDLGLGTGVVKVHSHDAMLQAIGAGFRLGPKVIVERFYDGNDYRVVVFRDRIVAAYQRVPLHIVGDGVSTVRALLETRQEILVRVGRDAAVNIGDARLIGNLHRAGLSVDSVPASGAVVRLLDNANLSTGGDAVDITARLHPDVAGLCQAIAHDMGLVLCGIDLIAPDATQPLRPDDDRYVVLEISATPGLDNYAALGEDQMRAVEQLYREILWMLREAPSW